MPDLLFELGCEEMPAHSVSQAGTDLAQAVERLLIDQGLAHGPIQHYETPRRIILAIEGLDARQADRTEEVRGPKIEAAFDPSGGPTRALEGFCRGQGCDPESVIRRDGYVWAIKHISGSSAKEVLADVLPQAVQSLRFDKVMRWGSSKNRFVRPVRWILATLDQELIPFTMFGIASGVTSRGHRFMAPEEFEPTTLDSLLSGLRKRFVEPDENRRRKVILDQIAATGEFATVDERLLDENVHLVEWPMVHVGTFAEQYLELPAAVLTTAMVKHQRFFPIKDSSDVLTNRFISVRNNGDESVVRAGNEWVLNARFNDAEFFYHEDQKRSLDDFLEMTRSMAFQPGLGSVRDRADRLAALTPQVFEAIGGTDPEPARLAGLYAKADLATGLVAELSSLQGVIGQIYGESAGLPPVATAAIGSQYALPEDPRSNLLGVALLVADQMDKLVGFLGLGLVPKGSSDPFGLRRAATLVVQAALGLADERFDLVPIASSAIAEYEAQGVTLESIEVRLAELFAARLEALLPSFGPDIHAAVLVDGHLSRVANPQVYAERCRIVAEIKASAETTQTFTRPLNILAAARNKGETIAAQFQPELAENESALRLNQAVEDPEFDTSTTQGLLDHLRWLQGPIHTFFEETMVMDPNPDVRANNLALLVKVEDDLYKAGDFSRLVYDEAE